VAHKTDIQLLRDGVAAVNVRIARQRHPGDAIDAMLPQQYRAVTLCGEYVISGSRPAEQSLRHEMRVYGP